MSFFARWLATSVAVAVAAWIVPGFAIGLTVQTWVAVAALGLVMTLLNGTVKPVLQVVSLPVTLLTCGVFYLIVNTFVLYLGAWLVDGLFGITIAFLSFGSALLASIVISLVTVVVSHLIGADA